MIVGAIGSGITIAAWQAFVPQLVPPEAIVSAVRLNGMQFTGARAFGPALAGLVLAQFGPGTAFMANALSFLLVIGALLHDRAAPGHRGRRRRQRAGALPRRHPLRAQTGGARRRDPGRALLLAARRLDDPVGGAVHAAGAARGRGEVRAARRRVRRGRDHRLGHHRGARRRGPPLDAHAAGLRGVRRRRDHLRAGAGLRDRPPRSLRHRTGPGLRHGLVPDRGAAERRRALSGPGACRST